MTEKQAWNPEIEEDNDTLLDDYLREVEFLANNENMTFQEASESLPEYKTVAAGYLDYLIMQKERGVLNKK